MERHSTKCRSVFYAASLRLRDSSDAGNLTPSTEQKMGSASGSEWRCQMLFEGRLYYPENDQNFRQHLVSDQK